MKSLHDFVLLVENELQAALTPENKVKVLEYAKILVPKVLPAPYVPFALMAITALESTIVLPATGNHDGC